MRGILDFPINMYSSPIAVFPAAYISVENIFMRVLHSAADWIVSVTLHILHLSCVVSLLLRMTESILEGIIL